MSTHTSRVVLLIAGLAVLAAWPIAQANRESRERGITHNELTQVLDCLTRKGARLGLDPSFADEKAFRVRYFYGVRDPDVDRENELHLIVYRRDQHSALLYELLITGKTDCPHFEFINTASLKLSKGRWVVRETLGGVYSYKRVQQLVNFISKTSLIRVPHTGMVQSCAECSYR
jgi:hypothetical protein